MPSRRVPLQEEERHQLRVASRRRYEEKNKERRREAAKLRMQGTQSKMAEADYHTRRKYRERVAAHSESYRNRRDTAEREQSRIADTETRRARKQEAKALSKKHARTTQHEPTKTFALKTPRQPAKKLRLDAPPQNQKPRPVLSAMPRRRSISPDSEEDSEEGEDGGPQVPLPQLFFEARAPHPARLRCKACGLDDCPGCACIVAAGSTALGVHMPFGAPPYDNGVLLCIPIYKADLGHEDRDAHTGGFYAVVHPEWMGVVTSGASLERQLKRYPGARMFSAFTWSRFHDLWTLDCSEYHEHENESPQTRARHSLRVRQQRRNEEHYFKLVAADEAIRVEEEGKWVKKEEMEYLAATRPPPVPLSPQRARLQFERVLGPGAGTRPLLEAQNSPFVVSDPSPSSDLDRRMVMDGNDHLKRSRSLQANVGGAPPTYSDFDNSEPGPSTPVGMKNEPRLYAVSGHSRVFRSKDRAVRALQDTPGAELFWSRDPKEVWSFIAEARDCMP
ncbi:hypothetical protein B0H14DRAFT_3552768 [Mycena olivaceomarginata]|nr:hypothetical protein B0H14DRAFT_3552768 [Mycena olivaceomarginata]